jgi:hypothetical protein
MDIRGLALGSHPSAEEKQKVNYANLLTLPEL